jgi:ribose 1,5-bisphosphokinase
VRVSFGRRRYVRMTGRAHQAIASHVTNRTRAVATVSCSSFGFLISVQSYLGSPTADVAIAGSERLIVFVGASGVDKAAVMRAWEVLQFPASRVHRIRRVVTSNAEHASNDDDAVSAADFQSLFAAGTFAATWYAHGRSFGVRRASLDPLAAGHWMMLSGSRVHLSTLRLHAPRLHVVEVSASVDVRRARLSLSQGLDADRRVALDLQSPKLKADLVVLNDGEAVSSARKVERWWLSLRQSADTLRSLVPQNKSGRAVS